MRHQYLENFHAVLKQVLLLKCRILFAQNKISEIAIFDKQREYPQEFRIFREKLKTGPQILTLHLKFQYYWSQVTSFICNQKRFWASGHDSNRKWTFSLKHLLCIYLFSVLINPGIVKTKNVVCFLTLLSCSPERSAKFDFEKNGITVFIWISTEHRISTHLK